MRIVKVIFAASLGLLAAISASNAWALTQQAFDQAGFQAAQAAGASIVVHVTAPWCPTCKAQHAVIDKLAANEDFKDLVVFAVDFDSQPDVWQKLKASSQSTIIAYKGETESGRLVGATQPDAIENLLRTALKK